jgi:hypothetical protein
MRTKLYLWSLTANSGGYINGFNVCIFITLQSNVPTWLPLSNSHLYIKVTLSCPVRTFLLSQMSPGKTGLIHHIKQIFCWNGFLPLIYPPELAVRDHVWLQCNKDTDIKPRSHGAFLTLHSEETATFKNLFSNPFNVILSCQNLFIVPNVTW